MKIKKTALILFILLLLISLAATPLWALSSEMSAQTTGEAFEELTDPPFSDELGTAGDHGENETRSNDEIVSATYLEDGVYAFRNVGNGNFWMDVRANNYTSSTNMQQYYTTTLPTDSFERSLLFKITRNETTNRYVIRLMLNNRLTFDFSGNNVMTKVIPAKDSEVAAVDTFAITRSGSGYTIRPNDSSYLVSANSSQASGSAGDPDSNLVRKTPTAAGNCGIWEIHRYTGTSRSGFSVSMSPTIPDGLAVGDHTLVAFATWSTVADANTPHLEVSSSFASRVTISDVSNNLDFRALYVVEGVKAGKVQLTYRIKNASGANTYNAYQTHLITPDFNSQSAYLQNKATEKYMYTPTSTAGANIQQHPFSTSDQKQWELYKVEGGYYCIMSPYSEKFVGISASDTATVRQYETANDYATWYLHETDSGGYAIINKALGALNRAIATPADTSGDGATLTVTAYTNDSSYRDEWILWPMRYNLTMNHYYDEGFDIRFSTNTVSAASKIESYSISVAERLLKLYGINSIIYITPHESRLDDCKKDMLNSDVLTQNCLDDYCTHATNHLTKAMLRSNLGNGTCLAPKLIWTGHIIHNDLASSSNSSLFSIVMNLVRKVNSNTYANLPEATVTQEYQYSLCHELSHQLGTHDHYCYKDYDSNRKCSNPYCDTCYMGYMSARTCLMSERSLYPSLTSDSLYCSDCKNLIESHLMNNH